MTSLPPTAAENDDVLTDLRALSAALEDAQVGGALSPWRASPFAWMHRLPTVAKHTAARDVLIAWVQRELGHCLVPERLNGASCLRTGHSLFSLKVSFQWDEGHYMFQQIRRGNFSHVMCFGVAPAGVHLWVVPVTDARLYETPQHVGHEGTAANYLLRKNPTQPPTWLDSYGGFAAAGLFVLEATLSEALGT